LDYALSGHSGPVFYLDRVVEFLIIATSHRLHSHEEALLDSGPSLIGRIVTLKEQHTEKSFVVEPKAVVPPKDLRLLLWYRSLTFIYQELNYLIDILLHWIGNLTEQQEVLYLSSPVHSEVEFAST